MKMHRPVVLHDPDTLDFWRGGTNLLIEGDQFLHPNFTARLEENPPTVPIEGSHDSRRSVAAPPARGKRLHRPNFFIGTGQSGLPIIGQFVEIEQDFFVPSLLDALAQSSDEIYLRLGARIGTIHMLPPTFVGDATALEQLLHPALRFQV